MSMICAENCDDCSRQETTSSTLNMSIYFTAKLLDRIDFLILSHLAWQELSRGVASIVAIAL